MSVANLKPRLQAAPKPPSALETLVGIEGEAMAAGDYLSLKHLAVNRCRALLGCGHVIWVRRDGARVKLDAITAQDMLDANTPFAQWLRADLSSRAKTGDLDGPSAWQFAARRADDAFTYPFIHAYFVPFKPHAKLGGLLFTNDIELPEAKRPLMERFGQIFGLCDAALRSKKRARMNGKKRVIFYMSCAALALIALIPVPMTSLAPAEVIASEPYVMASPIDGVIETILVEPNSVVRAGTPLIRFDTTALRNELLLAEEEAGLARARMRQAGLRAFVDPEAKRELAIAQAEVNLAQAKSTYARARLSKTEILAPRDGLALYANKTDWMGRPVSTGEAILQIAEPTRVSLRIDAPLAHGEALQEGARVRMFLDTDPMTPIDATLQRASFHASLLPEGGMAFETIAEFEGGITPRIGTRGVAKIYGERAPIGYWLARKPLTLARQITGL